MMEIISIMIPLISIKTIFNIDKYYLDNRINKDDIFYITIQFPINKPIF